MVDRIITSTSATAVGMSGPVNIKIEDWLAQNVKEFPVTLDIPQQVSEWISKIVTHWAFAEWVQAGTLCNLLGIERKEGRVMFGARIGNSASKINQLLQMHEFSVATNMSDLSAMLKRCEEYRNLVGHGVWMIDPETSELCVQNPAGEWRQPNQDSVSKRKYPEAVYITEGWFSSVLNEIKNAISALQNLDREIDAQP